MAAPLILATKLLENLLLSIDKAQNNKIFGILVDYSINKISIKSYYFYPNIINFCCPSISSYNSRGRLLTLISKTSLLIRLTENLLLLVNMAEDITVNDSGSEKLIKKLFYFNKIIVLITLMLKTSI